MAYTTSILHWREYTIEVRFAPDRFNIASHGVNAMSHIEVETIEPKRAPLPITETGYKSHFVDLFLVEEAGGAVALIKAWLDHEADTDKWRAFELAQRQLSLF